MAAILLCFPREVCCCDLSSASTCNRSEEAILPSAFHIGRLVTWAVVFAVLGGIPKVVFLSLPAEWNTHTLAVASGAAVIGSGIGTPSA